jgi:hypothetical protein
MPATLHEYKSHRATQDACKQWVGKKNRGKTCHIEANGTEQQKYGMKGLHACTGRLLTRLLHPRRPAGRAKADRFVFAYAGDTV